MKESIHTKKYHYHIILSFLLSAIIFSLFFISFEKNKFIPIHYHSWYASYHMSYRFYVLDIFEKMKDNYKFIFEHADMLSTNAFQNKLICVLFGIFFTLIHRFNLTYIRMFNFILIIVCITITLQIVKKKTTNDPRTIYFASLAWFTPYIIYLMRSGQNYFYGMCFLFFYFYCITINYDHKKFPISLLSGIFLLLAYASHRIMIIYASTLFVHVVFIFIALVRNKKLSQYLNFFISSLIGLIPFVPYYYFYKNNITELNTMGQTLHGAGHLQTALLLTKEGVPLLIGSSSIVILIFSPWVLKRLSQIMHKQNLLHIYIFGIIPISFLLLPLTIVFLFSRSIDMNIVMYTPLIPVVLVLCVRIFHYLPSLLKTFVLTTKLLVISLLLINNIFLFNVKSYIEKLYCPSYVDKYYKYFIKPFLTHDIDILSYLHNHKSTNILITNLFAKLDRTPRFMYLVPEGWTHLFNTLIETYAVTHNKKILYPHELSSYHTPDTLYIALVADRSILSIKDTSNPLFFKQLLGIDENELAFIKPLLIKSSTYYTIPIDMFWPGKIVAIFKIHFGLKKYARELRHANVPHLSIFYIE